MKELPKHYDQSKEAKLYKLWESSGYFAPEAHPPWTDNPQTNPNHGKPFTISMPPPNVTGTLHVGHAVMLALQDIMIRFERMRGRKTLWLPGTDHAAIATQSKVESEIYKREGKTRFDLGREEFLRRVEAFAQASHDTIVGQIKSLGSSCDWSREAFTLDQARTLAVRTAFKQMYEAGLIYRGKRIVNWDPKLQTTVSDDEIEWKEEQVPFYYLKYGPFEIGTARPETKFGDKYVVMHPKDKRYKNYKHGQQLEVDWMNGKVTATVIKDESVDPEFGTGVMTITPWHDLADFDIAQRHNLEFEQIIDFKGLLLPVAGEFASQHIKKARPLIVEKLKRQGLLVKIDEQYTHRIATNSRGGGIIEPQIKEQWFVDVNEQITDHGSRITLKELMKKAVQSGQVKIIPERFKKVYFHWIDNLRDWCISRQIWYGHQIPVWYCGGVEKTSQPRMGFHSSIVPELLGGKRRTYRLRDHKFNVGDRFVFKNSGNRILLGKGIITNVIKTTVGGIELPDMIHSDKYKTTPELIAAFKRMHPDEKVTKTTPAIIYDYEFIPFSKQDQTEGCGQMTVSETAPTKCPACGGTNFEQDPDTLDTWFSSGLWTFSTLGWPKQTKDLKTFHPTDVMETGYDILFFWVARMILMTGFLLKDIPFKTVYLHGLVRDKDRQKMSKSKGNVIDPLGIIEVYGADALRMALMVGNLPGNDLPLSEDKVRGYRNFANKIWNASRFVLQNTQDYNPPQSPLILRGDKTAATPPLKIRGGRGELLPEDKKILKDLDNFAQSITKKLEKYDFAHAAEDLYRYFWHTFADKVIEEAKPKLADNLSAEAPAKAEKKRASAQLLLKTMLETQLKLLHPFMPFVTEAIWQINHKDLLMIEKWPGKLTGD
ncbi:MAG: class I tRNA ligase family protein [Candidatus Doudnabacteria bacterium]|nr:class I tRNA ligase family protein [Candidatus Doudnabacteria bacterium]